MSTVETPPLAIAALDGLLELLEDAGVSATRDAGTFNPSPVGVLVGLPSWVGSTLGGLLFEVPVMVVSGDPLNTLEAVYRWYAIGEDAAAAVAADSYRVTTWASSSRAEPLPALEILATLTISHEEE